MWSVHCCQYLCVPLLEECRAVSLLEHSQLTLYLTKLVRATPIHSQTYGRGE